MDIAIAANKYRHRKHFDLVLFNFSANVLMTKRMYRSLAGYVVPLIPSLVYSVYYGGFLAQFVIEKMGMMGSLPQPYGINFFLL